MSLFITSNQGVDPIIVPDVALLVVQLLMMMMLMVTPTKSKSKNSNLQASLPPVQAVREPFEDGASDEELRGTSTSKQTERQFCCF